ncbi:MAG: DUF547 domain-containing protein [Candidatus Eisenbacteria bacterium]|nr:DUF547 domain-containing protein [Candidatus Eisenbacteria bacterium]MBU1951070.1 DUF547 domain-containing protein [Candidatus Eisenbacteria bacterium]
MPSRSRVKRLTINSTILLVMILVISAGAQTGRSKPFDHYHVVLDALLYRHVHNGRVDFEKLRIQGAELDGYLRQAGGLDRSDYDSFTRDQKLALLLNTYNAMVLKIILRDQQENSILDVAGKWDEKRFLFLRKECTLTQLREEFLRKDFDEPRIHCALTYASIGGPALIPEAYMYELLDKQLSAAAENFVRDSLTNHLDRENSILYVSKIFEWYGEDFIPKYGKTIGPSEIPSGAISNVPSVGEATPLHRAIVGFFSEYLDESDAAYLQSHPVEVRFLEFDWRLDSISTN